MLTLTPRAGAQGWLHGEPGVAAVGIDLAGAPAGDVGQDPAALWMVSASRRR
jgi:hypothetical protein